ncbi:MAG: extracellular solute-binding protein [Chloroflexi bacterium]|nr:extracellular solute-binding protein [Chloroflexota bacterium]
MIRRIGSIGALLIAASMLFAACTSDSPSPAPTAEPSPPGTPAATPETPPATTEPEEALSGSLTVYSGRSEALIAPILEQFATETGVTVDVRYGGTAEMAAALLEEGGNSPADVFIAQDPGGLGAVEVAGLFAPLPESISALVDDRWESSLGGWVALSGRARVLVHSTELAEDELPASVYDLTDPRWEGQVGWAPSNGSFQAFVTAMRAQDGEERTREWLEAMIANGAVTYGNNRAQVEAVDAGEIQLGLVNHYYLHPYLAERGESFGARNYHFPAGDIGSLLSVAGGGVLKTSQNPAAAEALLAFLLSNTGQQYFADETYEYPVIDGIAIAESVTPLDQIEPPAVDINDLTELEATLDLLREVGALE